PFFDWLELILRQYTPRGLSTGYGSVWIRGSCFIPIIPSSRSQLEPGSNFIGALNPQRTVTGARKVGFRHPPPISIGGARVCGPFPHRIPQRERSSPTTALVIVERRRLAQTPCDPQPAPLEGAWVRALRLPADAPPPAKNAGREPWRRDREPS